MDKVAIQARTNALYDRAAPIYEDQPGHGLADVAERQAWEEDLREALHIPAGARVLDVGTGTGVFARLFAEWGCTVVGIDPSEPMLNEARNRTPNALVANLTFIQADTLQQGGIFADASFDYIVSRQVVCHLCDPLEAFGHWFTWLKPDGYVLVVDGLWSRAGWKDDDLVDSLPLSCLQTRGTVSYLLEKAGFLIERTQWLARVNDALGCTTTSPRYCIVARRVR